MSALDEFVARVLSEEEEIVEIHLCNHAVKSIPDGICQQIVYMYEDQRIEHLEAVRASARLICSICPGKFLLIDTGDYITGSAGWGAETYDAYYHLYIARADKWRECKDKIMEIDRKWREAAQLRANGEEYDHEAYGDAPIEPWRHEEE